MPPICWVFVQLYAYEIKQILVGKNEKNRNTEQESIKKRITDHRSMQRDKSFIKLRADVLNRLSFELSLFGQTQQSKIKC